MFDTKHEDKLYWPSFEAGIRRCITSDENDLDQFIFDFFRLNG